MGILSRIRIRVPEFKAAIPSEAAARVISSSNPENDALMALREQYPEIFDFITRASDREESPLDVFAALRKGRDPGVLLDSLRDRSRKAYENSWLKDGLDIPGGDY